MRDNFTPLDFHVFSDAASIKTKDTHTHSIHLNDVSMDTPTDVCYLKSIREYGRPVETMRSFTSVQHFGQKLQFLHLHFSLK